MAKYKIIFDGDLWEEDTFDSYEAADEYAHYLQGCEMTGAEISHMSNPGDYDFDEDNWEYSDYEIIEVDE